MNRPKFKSIFDENLKSTLMFKRLDSDIFLDEMNTFIQQACISWTFIMIRYFNPNLDQIWIKKCTVESESWVKFLNYIFNSTFWFVHILPNFWVKTTQHCLEGLECISVSFMLYLSKNQCYNFNIDNNKKCFLSIKSSY